MSEIGRNLDSNSSIQKHHPKPSWLYPFTCAFFSLLSFLSFLSFLPFLLRIWTICWKESPRLPAHATLHSARVSTVAFQILDAQARWNMLIMWCHRLCTLLRVYLTTGTVYVVSSSVCSTYYVPYVRTQILYLPRRWRCAGSCPPPPWYLVSMFSPCSMLYTVYCVHTP